jgi:hypothetical protein
MGHTKPLLPNTEAYGNTETSQRLADHSIRNHWRHVIPIVLLCCIH